MRFAARTEEQTEMAQQGYSIASDHGMLWTVLILVPVTFVAILAGIVAVI
jgi:hypothetical protein